MADVVEIWESNIPGRVSMDVPGPRDTTRQLTTLGKGQRLRIKPEDREIVEEGVRDIQNNPFANGMLQQVGGPRRVPPIDAEADLGEQQFSDDDLAVFFSMTPDDFRVALDGLSENNVRRLQTLFTDKGGTVAQKEVINDYVEAKWPITSGDTASYREMRQEPAR
jgi:hypothetical protein